MSDIFIDKLCPAQANPLDLLARHAELLYDPKALLDSTTHSVLVRLWDEQAISKATDNLSGVSPMLDTISMTDVMNALQEDIDLLSERSVDPLQIEAVQKFKKMTRLGNVHAAETYLFRNAIWLHLEGTKQEGKLIQGSYEDKALLRLLLASFCAQSIKEKQEA